MATEHEEHRNHRELLAATLLPFAVKSVKAQLDSDPEKVKLEAFGIAFALADQFISYSRGTP